MNARSIQVCVSNMFLEHEQYFYIDFVFVPLSLTSVNFNEYVVGAK